MNETSWKWLYYLSMIVWIVIGIGYWAMVIAFVTKAFKVFTPKILQDSFAILLKFVEILIDLVGIFRPSLGFLTILEKIPPELFLNILWISKESFQRIAENWALEL